MYNTQYRLHIIPKSVKSRITGKHIVIYIYLSKTKKFGCVGRGDLTSLFFSKVAK